MSEADEPYLRIAVRDYVDRELARSVEHERELLAKDFASVADKFVTIEAARRIALDAVRDSRDEAQRLAAVIDPLRAANERIGGATAFGAFTLERIISLIAIAIALYAVLSR